MDYFDDLAASIASGRVPGVVAAVRDAAGQLLLTRIDVGEEPATSANLSLNLITRWLPLYGYHPVHRAVRLPTIRL